MYPPTTSQSVLYEKDIRKMYEEGRSMAYMAKELGIGRSSVSRYMKEFGLDTSKKSKHRKIPLATHTDEIIRLYNDGMGCCKLSKKYDCAETSIIKLLRKNGLDSNQHMVRYSVNEKFFDDIKTENQAYVYGFFVGDGCNQKNGVVAIGITDLEILEKMRNVMKFTGPIEKKTMSESKKHHKQMYRISIGCRYMSNRLTEIHCPYKKTYLTKFPSYDIVPKYLIRHYIRGVLDSDGGFHLHPQNKAPMMSIAGTPHLLLGIKNCFMKELGINCYIYPHKGCEVLKLNKIADITKFSNWIYKDATIYLERKYNKVKHLLED